MRVTVDVPSRADGDALKRSLEDPTIRAVTTICGVLFDLPEARRRAVVAIVTHAIESNGHAEVRAPRPLNELPAMRLGLDQGSLRDTGE